MASPRTLIVGGDSMIGKALAERLSADGLDVASTSRRQGSDVPLDLSAISDAGRLTAGYDCIVLAAAVTGRAACQADSDRAYAVNVTAPLALATPVLARSGRVLFLSTHTVLGGAKPFLEVDAPYEPPDLYAEHKAEAERRLRGLPGSAGLTIVRPTKVLASTAGLIQQWASSIARQTTIDVYEDLVMAPVSLGHVVDTIAANLRRPSPEIVHLSGSTEISYADFTIELAGRMGWQRDHLNRMKGRPVNPIAAITPPHASLAAAAPQDLEAVFSELTR
ncbi:MAG: sugar nucleotide-binding protein [Pseudomonadota bacterium]